MPTVEITLDEVYDLLADLGYPIVPEDQGRVEYLIQLMTEKVKLNTHLDGVPESLHNTVLGMVAGEFLAGKFAIGALDDNIIATAVKRISEGDTTVEYAVGQGGDKTPSERFKSYIDALRSPPDYVFASVRRMKW